MKQLQHFVGTGSIIKLSSNREADLKALEPHIIRQVREHDILIVLNYFNNLGVKITPHINADDDYTIQSIHKYNIEENLYIDENLAVQHEIPSMEILLAHPVKTYLLNHYQSIAPIL